MLGCFAFPSCDFSHAILARNLQLGQKFAELLAKQ
jgi:hypothetical protein